MIKVDNGNKRYQQLLELGIVVRNTSKYYNCKNTLRITVGKKDENNALISALLKWMSNEKNTFIDRDGTIINELKDFSS